MQNSITPGEILLEEYLKPMGISQNAMARAVGVAPRAINEIVHGKRSITPAMSIRFGAFFGQSDEFWHGLQVECDFRALAKKRKKLIDRIQPASTVSHVSDSPSRYNLRLLGEHPTISLILEVSDYATRIRSTQDTQAPLHPPGYAHWQRSPGPAPARRAGRRYRERPPF